jgi:hypothetical protein
MPSPSSSGRIGSRHAKDPGLTVPATSNRATCRPLHPVRAIIQRGVWLSQAKKPLLFLSCVSPPCSPWLIKLPRGMQMVFLASPEPLSAPPDGTRPKCRPWNSGRKCSREALSGPHSILPPGSGRGTTILGSCLGPTRHNACGGDGCERQARGRQEGPGRLRHTPIDVAVPNSSV